MGASYSGTVEVVKRLLNAGAQVDLRSIDVRPEVDELMMI
jgi:hypothetical protein